MILRGTLDNGEDNEASVVGMPSSSGIRRLLCVDATPFSSNA